MKNALAWLRLDRLWENLVLAWEKGLDYWPETLARALYRRQRRHSIYLNVEQLEIRLVPAFSITPTAFAALENQQFQGPVATFTGASSSASAYSATVLWGDGQQSSGTISANGDGSFSVNGSHTYKEEGQYAVAV